MAPNCPQNSGTLRFLFLKQKMLRERVEPAIPIPVNGVGRETKFLKNIQVWALDSFRLLSINSNGDGISIPVVFRTFRGRLFLTLNKDNVRDCN